MMPTPCSTKSEPDLNPQQFALSELLWLVFAAAVLLAIVSPFVRWLPRNVLIVLGIVVSAEALFLAGIVAFASRRRKKLLEKSGRLIGVGNGGESKEPRWIRLSIAMMLFYFIATHVVGTFLLTLLLTSKGSRFSPLIIECAFFSWFSTMVSIRFLRWRLNPSAVEFWENGMSSMDVLIPWNRLEVRRSKTASQRIAIVISPVHKVSGKSTYMVWVEESLLETLLSMQQQSK